MMETRKENKLKKVVKKVLEIGAVLAIGIAIVSDIVDYIYIPSDLKLITLISGGLAMVLYIVSMVLENK